MTTIHLYPQDSIQGNLDRYPLNEKIKIYLEPGIYHQKLRLEHHHLQLINKSASEVVLTMDDFAYKLHRDGLLYNTFRTPTVTVLGDHVEFHNITIKNDAGSGPTVGQAIALSLYGNQTCLYNCRIIGFQDTLFIGPLPVDLTERYNLFLPPEERKTTSTRHFFKNCRIEGDVDFIFGSGTALFSDCTIVAKQKGYICAPSTYESNPFGFIFYACTIENLSNHPVYLGRPWRSHGAISFLNCTFKGLY
ncbi:MAG: pectin methylesterase, partial [Acholeplasmataceae bacterium]|nr:pectin methylesterase [Acholeplasmataceae bacterium]